MFSYYFNHFISNLVNYIFIIIVITKIVTNDENLEIIIVYLGANGAMPMVAVLYGRKTNICSLFKSIGINSTTSETKVIIILFDITETAAIINVAAVLRSNSINIILIKYNPKLISPKSLKP